MFNKIFARIFEFQLLLSTFECAFSDYKRDLKCRILALIIGVLSVIAATVLSICLFYTAIVGTSYGFYSHGMLSAVEAVLLGTIVMMAVIICLFLYGKAKLADATILVKPKEKEKQKSSAQRRTPSYNSAIDDLIDGFLEGLLAEKKKEPQGPPTENQVK